jgi:hypothetical protein
MFVTDEEFARLDRETLDMLLERTHNKAIEATLKLLPEVIVGLIVRTKGVQKTFDNFKEQFPMFVGKEKELAQVIQDIELEDGSLDMQEVLKKVPERMKQFTIDVPEEQPHTVEEVERLANGFL